MRSNRARSSSQPRMGFGRDGRSVSLKSLLRRAGPPKGGLVLFTVRKHALPHPESSALWPRCSRLRSSSASSPRPGVISRCGVSRTASPPQSLSPEPRFARSRGQQRSPRPPQRRRFSSPPFSSCSPAAGSAGAMSSSGDVKLATAVALGLPPEAVWPFIVLTALAGGVLSAVYLLAIRARPRQPSPQCRGRSVLRRVLAAECWRVRHRGPLPYGIALCASGVLLIANGQLRG